MSDKTLETDASASAKYAAALKATEDYEAAISDVKIDTKEESDDDDRNRRRPDYEYDTDDNGDEKAPADIARLRKFAALKTVGPRYQQLIDAELAAWSASVGGAAAVTALRGVLRAPGSRHSVWAYGRRHAAMDASFIAITADASSAISHRRVWREVAQHHRMKPYWRVVPRAFRPFVLHEKYALEYDSHHFAILPMISHDTLSALMGCTENRAEERAAFIARAAARATASIVDIFTEYIYPLVEAGKLFAQERAQWRSGAESKTRAAGGRLALALPKPGAAVKPGANKPTVKPAAKSTAKRAASEEKALEVAVDEVELLDSYCAERVLNRDGKAIEWDSSRDELLDRLIKRHATKIIIPSPPLPPVDDAECKLLAAYLSDVPNRYELLGGGFGSNPALRGILKCAPAFAAWCRSLLRFLVEEENLAHIAARDSVTLDAPFVFNCSDEASWPLLCNDEHYERGISYSDAVRRLAVFTHGLSSKLDLSRSYLTGSCIAAATMSNPVTIYPAVFDAELTAMLTAELTGIILPPIAAIIASYATTKVSDHMCALAAAELGPRFAGRINDIRTGIDLRYPRYYVTNSPVVLENFDHEVRRGKTSCKVAHTGPLAATLTVTTRTKTQSPSTADSKLSPESKTRDTKTDDAEELRIKPSSIKTGVAKTGVAKTGVAKTGVAKTGITAKTGTISAHVSNSMLYFKARFAHNDQEWLSKFCEINTESAAALDVLTFNERRQQSTQNWKELSFESKKEIKTEFDQWCADGSPEIKASAARPATPKPSFAEGPPIVTTYKLELKRGADIDVVVDAKDEANFDAIAADHFAKVRELWPRATMAREDKPGGGHMWNVDLAEYSDTFRPLQIYRGNAMTMMSHHVPAVRGCYGGKLGAAGENSFILAASLIEAVNSGGQYSNLHFFASKKCLAQDVLAKYDSRECCLKEPSASPAIMMYRSFLKKSIRAKQWYATIPNLCAHFSSNPPPP